MTTGETYGAHAHLYDIAFSWDIGQEVDWLLSRLGPGVGRILEPACGSGRTFPAFARRGVTVVGLDISETMVARARDRMTALGEPRPRVLQADMTRFDLDDTLDGAICPINSIGHLHNDAGARAHLDSVARHLRPGARYLVQVDLVDPASMRHEPDDGSCWEVECDGLIVRASWRAVSFDASTRQQIEVSRFEVLTPEGRGDTGSPHAGFRWKLEDGWCPAPLRAGLRAGTVLEEEHRLLKWSWDQWLALIEPSPFTLAAVYGGDDEHRPVPLGKNVENVELTWHELVSP
jgi:SAM-dependent methyltransferase